MSNYKISYLVTNKNYTAKNGLSDFLSGDIITLPNYDPDESMPKLKDAYKEGIVRLLCENGTTFSCRESVLYRASLEVNGFQHNNLYNSPIFMVEYFKEGGEDLSEEIVETILEIGKKFYGYGSSSIKIFQTPGKKTSITVSQDFGGLSKSEVMEYLCIISALLYIFRKEYIMENILEEFPDKARWENLFLSLSKKFLEFPWGGPSNPAIALSLFFYRTSRRIMQTSFEFWISGPAYLAQQITDTRTIINYLKDVYIPVCGTTLNIAEHHLSYCASDFRDSIALLLELLKSSGKDKND